MKKISEMTFEELQDYASDLQTQLDTNLAELEQSKIKVNELHELNTTLQRRNNDLFKKVEQQPTGTTSQPIEEPTPETCEEFATKIYKEIR